MSADPIRADGSPPTWSTQQERGSLWLLKLMAWIAVTLGRPVARGILHPIALYFLLCAPAVRRRSLRYLGRALGRPAGWRDVYRHVHSFAATVLDRVYFARGRLPDFELTLSGVEFMDQAVAQGQGAVLLGAHFGSFEALHALGSSRPGLRVAMVMYPDNARMIHGVLQAIAPGMKLDVIAIGGAAATLKIRDWLDAGGLAGLLGDRFLDADKRRGAAVRLPFLGREAPFNDGALRLAMLLRQRVIFMVGLYHGGRRYELRFEPLADFSQRAANPDQAEARLRAALQAYAARLEALCREAPCNWFNFHDFWAEDAA
ncbi:MAG: acyl-CoA synthetase [Burkholderiales bacterium]|nr:acyl-CoA synthetase [Burkholderiales bacterium]